MPTTLPPVERPIIVDPNPVPAQVWVAVRALLQIAGGALVSRGIVDTATLETIIGALLIIGPFIWAQMKARKNVARLTVLAEAAPNTVAMVDKSGRS